MNIKVAIMLIFAIAYGLGFFMGKTQEDPVKKEVAVKTEKTDHVEGIGPCKSYITANQPESFSHSTFTVVCPKEYTVSTTTLY